jgi:hypothetical protein
MMKSLLANMFPGMQFLPLIGICVLFLIFVGLTIAAFTVLRKAFPNRRTSARILSPLLGAIPILVFIVWSTRYDSPLKLPKGATDVKIRRNFPFNLTIDDNLRFRVSPTEFRSWLEDLCGQSWESIQSNANDMRFEAFADGRYTSIAPDVAGKSRAGEPFSSPKAYWTVSWMDTSAVKSGYLVQQSRAFNGWLIYDARSELVYYNFWD